MNRVYKQRVLSIAIGSILLISCVSSKPVSEKTTVTRSLVSAKSYSHPTKKDTKEDMKVCRNTVPREQIDKCMSEKGWSIKSKKYD